MNTEEFTSLVYAQAIERGTEDWVEAIEATDLATATSPSWLRAHGLYSHLSKDDRAALIEILQQTSVDCISEIFGILDGTTLLVGAAKPMQLMFDGKAISGNLQDYFLWHHEQRVGNR